MSIAPLPTASTALTQGGDTITRPYYNFLLNQSSITTNISALEAEVLTLENDVNTLTTKVDSLPGSYRIFGPSSVNIGGSIGSGAIILTLTNDVVNPGSSKYYGTDNSGAKGWNTLPVGVIPFFLADLTSEPIPLSSSSEIPFFLEDGSESDIPLAA